MKRLYLNEHRVFTISSVNTSAAPWLARSVMALKEFTVRHF